MVCEDKEKEESSLCRIRKVCRYISIFVKIAFAVFCICWLVAAGFMVFSISGLFSEGVGAKVIMHLLRGTVIAVLFIMLIGVFSDAANGRSPFTLEQVKRLRIMALSLLVYAVFEVAFSASSVMMQLGSINSGYFSTNGSGIITIDFAPFIAAAVVYAFSFVFKYGVLLQEFSDDVI